MSVSIESGGGKSFAVCAEIIGAAQARNRTTGKGFFGHTRDIL
jgi:hypothetical protein